MGNSGKSFELTHGIGRYVRSNFNTITITCVLIAVAFVLLQEAEKGTLLWDESVHALDAYNFYRILPTLTSDPLGSLVRFAEFSPYYPPMFGIATGLAYAFFGVTPFVARATSIFFGLVTLLFSYLLASEISDRRMAVSGVILLASTPIFLFVSTLAFHITIGLAFSVSGLYFYLRALQKGNLRTYALAGALETFSILSNYILLPIYLMTIVHYLVFHKRRVSQIAALGLPFLLAVPWTYYTLIVLSQLRAWTFSLSATVDAYKRLVWSDPAAWYWYPAQLPRQIGILQSLAVVPALAYSIMRLTRQRLFLLSWLCSVYLAFVLIPNKDWRYTSSYVPALTIIVADALWSASRYLSSITSGIKIKRQFIRPTFFAMVILILVAASVTSQSISQAHEVNIAIEPAARYIAQRLGHNESVVVLLASNCSSPPLLAFELARFGKSNDVWMYPDLPVDVGAAISINTTRLFSRVTETGTRFGLLWIGAQSPLVVNLVERLAGDPRIVSTVTFGDGLSQVLIYEFAVLKSSRAIDPCFPQIVWIRIRADASLC